MKISKTLMLVLAFFITSCSDDEPTVTPVIPEDNLDCTSDFQKHSNATSFQNLLDDYANNGFVGMTLLVDHPADGLWMGSSGFANLEDSLTMNPCHLHHTASLYKTYIATIVMQLAEEEKVSLDGLLADYLTPDITDRLPNGNAITIKNLLQHRTGIADIFEAEFLNDFFGNPTKQYTILELLEYVYDKDPLSDPDSAYYYSDANFSLLTLLIEKVEGDFIQALKDRIFIPLELNDTYFLEDQTQVPSELADSYWERLSDGLIENNTAIQIAVATGLRGSEGIVTSVDNLKTFIQALATGELVTDIAQMTDFLAVPTEVQQQGVYSGYGMGLMKVQISGEVWYGHFGNQIGSGAIVLYNAEKETTMVAMQNTGTFFSDNLKEKFFYQLLNDVEEILF